ncbi:MAG: CopG family transcriptional regulator [Actinomycetota bacterium]
MATEKVSLTLDRGVLKEARGRVGRRGLSSYVDAALRHKLQQDRLRALLSELESEHGPVPKRIESEVRREWPADARSVKPKPRRR